MKFVYSVFFFKIACICLYKVEQVYYNDQMNMAKKLCLDIAAKANLIKNRSEMIHYINKNKDSISD
jgi:hypothetical protein